MTAAFAGIGAFAREPARLTDREQRRGRTVVAHVTWSLVAGGAEMYALTIASNLDRRHFRSVMCGVDQGGALESEIAQQGIAFRIMQRRPGIDWRLMWRLYRFFRRERVDVIHTHHFNQLFYSLPGAILAGARIIHTEHSIECYRKRRLRVAMRLMSLLCRKVTAIGPQGAGTLRGAVGIPRRKLAVIRAGVSDAPMPSTPEARAALGLGERQPVAVIVARLYPEKNHRLLLEAFARVVQQLPAAKLLIAGEGTERQAIEAEIDRLGLVANVRLLGVRRDVPRILAAADVFVLSSDREGLPIAVLEAMAAGKAVVATAVGDLPQIVADGRTGRLVPPKDADALARALVEVLSDRPRSIEMGRRGRRLIEASYSAAEMVRRYAELYQGN